MSVQLAADGDHRMMGYMSDDAIRRLIEFADEREKLIDRLREALARNNVLEIVQWARKVCMMPAETEQ